MADQMPGRTAVPGSEGPEGPAGSGRGGVHPVAAAGFEAGAEQYERARPSYPPEAVAWLAARLGIGPGRRVADLAAGTGKLTALLEPLGADLVAVEPVAAMRAQLRRRLPGVPVVAGTAESMPFADAGLDAVTVAQAFHWFDTARASGELVRVLRPGGRLGLLWNLRDRSVDWVDRVWTVMDRVERHAPWRGHGDGTPGPAATTVRWRMDHLESLGTWGPFEHATFEHVHRTTPDEVVDRMHSVSHIAALDAVRRSEVLDEVRTILREHPDTRRSRTLEVRYRLDVSVAGRLL